MKNTTTEELDGQMSFDEEIVPDQESTEDQAESSKDPLKEAVEEQLRKIRRQNILIGAQTACKVVLEKIIVAENQPGKRTMNDYKRLIKDLKNFCNVGLSRKVNADGETDPIEERSATAETVQN